MTMSVILGVGLQIPLAAHAAPGPCPSSDALMHQSSPPNSTDSVTLPAELRTQLTLSPSKSPSSKNRQGRRGILLERFFKPFLFNKIILISALKQCKHLIHFVYSMFPLKSLDIWDITVSMTLSGPSKICVSSGLVLIEFSTHKGHILLLL